jgi:hypothetical protein
MYNEKSKQESEIEEAVDTLCIRDNDDIKNYNLLLYGPTAPITLSMLKSRGPHCTNPTDDLGRILGVHVKEMAHRRPQRLFAGLIERHPNFAVKNFECWAVPILDDVVMGGKARVNEGAQVFADYFAPVPICHAQVAHRILQFMPLPKVFSSISFHMAKSQSGGRGFREGYRVHNILHIFFVNIFLFSPRQKRNILLPRRLY